MRCTLFENPTCAVLWGIPAEMYETSYFSIAAIQTRRQKELLTKEGYPLFLIPSHHISRLFSHTNFFLPCVIVT